MKKSQSDYWFSLKPYVYVNFDKKKRVLLYNTQNGKYFETSVNQAVTLVNQIYDPINVGVTAISKELMSDTSIEEFISTLLELEMADVLPQTDYPHKPVQLIPILNLQSDVERLDQQAIGENVKNYLLELNLFINDSCGQKCEHCTDYHKQVMCCTSTNCDQELSVEMIQDVLQQSKYSSINRINILGGDLSKYSSFDKLQEIMQPLKDVVHYKLHYLNYLDCNFIDNQTIDLIVTFPIQTSILKEVMSKIDLSKTNFSFIIENEEMYYETEKLIEEFGITKYEVLPFYTGKNIRFFEENVYMEKDDIFANRLKMREIFRNQKLNSNNFGTLYIFPDGATKANSNSDVIGDIHTDRILDILYNEMVTNTAWRQIRNSAPCNACLYQFICPAPSNYEKAIGKYNMCQIVID